MTLPKSSAVSCVPKAELTDSMSCSSVWSAVKHPTSFETKPDSEAWSERASTYRTCASLTLPPNPAACISLSIDSMVSSTNCSFACSSAERFSTTIVCRRSVSISISPLKIETTATIGMIIMMIIPSTTPPIVFITFGFVSKATAIFLRAAATVALIIVLLLYRIGRI